MQYKIRYSIFAKEDMREIKKYLSQFYPNTSQKFMQEMKRHVERLKDTPKIYEKYGNDSNYRKMIVRDYAVFYQINEDAKVVFLYRILYGKVDIPRHL